MIRSIVLPEKIGDYYLFPKRIVGIDIGKTHVSATKIVLHARTCTIEQSFEEKVDASEANYTQSVANALASVIKKCGKYDTISSSFSGTVPFVKEIKLPFVNDEQIRKVIGFEIEGDLPFPIAEAVIDFIVTKPGDKEKESSVLIVAVQKKIIDKHRQLYTDAQIVPNVITIDLLQIFSLYTQAPEYAALQGSVAIIDIGYSYTGIAYVHNGQLRRIRTLNFGITTIAKQMAQTGNVSEEKAIKAIVDGGIDEHDSALQEALKSLWSQVQFTINSIALQIKVPEKLTRVLLLGEGARVKGLSDFAQESLDAPCSLFDVQELLKNPKYEKGNQDLRTINHHLVSLSVAVPQILNEDFNLNKTAQQKSALRLWTKQLIVGGALTLIILTSLITHSFLVLKKLKREAVKSEQQVMEVIKTTFKIPEETESLDEAVTIINDQVTKEEKRWLVFSPAMRSRYLYYLQELSSVINRKDIGLQLQKLSIDDTAIELQGSVRDIDAVNKLEDDLRKTKLFVSVPDLQNPNFEAEPLRLLLKRKMRG